MVCFYSTGSVYGTEIRRSLSICLCGCNRRNGLYVMGGIFVLYKDAYAKALSVDAGAVLGIIGGVISFNGVIEAIVAAIIVAALGMVLNKLKPIQK